MVEKNRGRILVEKKDTIRGQRVAEKSKGGKERLRRYCGRRLVEMKTGYYWRSKSD